MGVKTRKLGNVVDQVVEWQSVFTGDGSTGLTAVAGRGYFIDTTSGTVTVTLPASPKIGDTIGIIDYAGTFATNNVTLNRNGNNIKGSAANETISTSNGAYTYVYIDGTQGWKNSTTTDDLPSFISATGGTVTTSGDYKIHTFTGDGCFVVSSLGSNIPCAQASTVDYLVVAGGAAGGHNCTGFNAGGGGGAGGMRFSATTYCSPSPRKAPAAITISTTTYPITVGAGGAGACGPCSAKGNPGSNSVFSTITSTGGGGGGSTTGCGPQGIGASGGSGGGGVGSSPSGNSGGAGNTPPTSPSQGSSGGSGAAHPDREGGGGGGLIATGCSASNCGATPGNGGDGLAISITGSPVAYAGGGGGATGPDTPGAGTAGTGGLGGGGAGATNAVPIGNGNGVPGTSGTANTGGGGGGSNAGGTSGAGGKGIIIIRYKYQ